MRSMHDSPREVPKQCNVACRIQHFLRRGSASNMSSGISTGWMCDKDLLIHIEFALTQHKAQSTTHHTKCRMSRSVRLVAGSFVIAAVMRDSTCEDSRIGQFHPAVKELPVVLHRNSDVGVLDGLWRLHRVEPSRRARELSRLRHTSRCV